MAEDTAVAALKLRNRALGIIEAATAIRTKDFESLSSIFGSNETVEIGGFTVNEIRHWRFTKELPLDNDAMEKFSTDPPTVYGCGHRAYDYVVDCLTKIAALMDGLQGRRSLEMISAIHEPIETGLEVPLHFTPKLCRLGLAS